MASSLTNTCGKLHGQKPEQRCLLDRTIVRWLWKKMKWHRALKRASRVDIVAANEKERGVRDEVENRGESGRHVDSVNHNSQLQQNDVPEIYLEELALEDLAGLPEWTCNLAEVVRAKDQRVLSGHFDSADREEMDGLTARKMFQIISADSILAAAQMYFGPAC
eukprot:Plantae.Rhodophyta-Rhodochaete_pulchella.ctg26757.p1 GENE.Plantae.Rhodophyta-Rhodochaete_pulchella.ctg26757~~Plantae.Rhodophyta-Rhodochaete_pulchella.ctg26757.p1  ORF type:complete len:164 (+),score=25.35 Plantae.Rhodophyta-Rhodochaete_pulchella.ctg26757:346-837(+)